MHCDDSIPLFVYLFVCFFPFSMHDSFFWNLEGTPLQVRELKRWNPIKPNKNVMVGENISCSCQLLSKQIFYYLSAYAFRITLVIKTSHDIKVTVRSHVRISKKIKKSRTKKSRCTPKYTWTRRWRPSLNLTPARESTSYSTTFC